MQFCFQKSGRINWILLIILLVTFLLRLYKINQPYVDACNWRQASTAMMAQNFLERNHNILYPEINWGGPGETYNGREFQTVTYLASALYYVFGVHDWIGRIIAVFFGTWGVFALYKLTRRTWNEREAIAVASLMAITPFSIYIERCFLPDPAMVALTTTGLWLVVRYLQTDSIYSFVFGVFFITLGFLTKITGMLVGPAILYAIYIIYKNRCKLSFKDTWLIILAGLLCLTIVASYYLWALHLSRTYPPYHFAGESNWIWDSNSDVKVWLKHGYYLSNFLQRAVLNMWGLPILLLAAVGLYPASIKQNNIPGKPRLMFHFWLAGCMFFYLIGVYELNNNFQNYHVFTPVIVAFAGRGLVFICPFSKTVRTCFIMVAAIFLVILATNVIPLSRCFAPSGQGDYEMGLALRKAKKTDSDLVITLASAIGSPMPIYYSNSKGWLFPPAGLNEHFKELPETDEKAIEIFNTLKLNGAKLFAVRSDYYDEIAGSLPKFYATLHDLPSTVYPGFVIIQLDGMALK